jgi:hypothetical protein
MGVAIVLSLFPEPTLIANLANESAHYIHFSGSLMDYSTYHMLSTESRDVCCCEQIAAQSHNK